MKTIVTTFILSIWLTGGFGQAPLVKQWDKAFGGTDRDDVSWFQQTIDGGFIIAGDSRSGISGDRTQPSQGYGDYWVIKTDALGNKQWDKRFGGADYDNIRVVQQTSDGGYILGGTSGSEAEGDKTQASWGDKDYWIVKIDAWGNKQWDKRFGAPDGAYFNSLCQTSDGGYLLGGYTDSNIGGDKTQYNWGRSDYWIVKINAMGIKQWDKRFGGTGDDYLMSLQQTTDGGYILGGVSESDISGDKTQAAWGYYSSDYWIVKIDAIGNKQWDKRFGGTGNDYFSSLEQTADGGYILGGRSESNISGDKTEAMSDVFPQYSASDYWIVKIDALGNKQWDKKFGGLDTEGWLNNISQTSDGGYVMVGASLSQSGGDKTENNLDNDQPWIVKTDALGNKQWDKTIFTAKPYVNCPISTGASNITQTKDGCYVIANFTDAGIGGDKSQARQGDGDYWLIKFCDTTFTISDMDNLTEEQTVSVYPNPSYSDWQLTVSSNFLGGTAEVFDASGKLVFQQLITTPQSLITPDVSKGIYLLRISSSKGSVMRKLVRM